MKTKLLLISLLTCTTLLQAQPFWEEVPHSDSVWVWSLGVENPDFMLMGTGGNTVGGIYKSDYEVFDWEWKGPEYPKYQLEFDIAENSEGTIFISGRDYVYKSEDSGETWEDIFYFLGNLVSIEIDENDGIWVGTWGAIFYSDDSGISWDTSLYTINSEAFNDFAFGANGEVYAVSHHYTEDTGGFYISYDNGLNWENPGLHEVGAKTIEVNSQNSIFVGSVYFGVFKSDDNGLYWDNVYPYIDAVTMVIDESDVIYFGANYQNFPGIGVYYSEDDGQTWDTVNRGGLSNLYVQKIYIGMQGHLYTVCHPNHGHKVFRSINPITNMDEISVNNIYRIYPNPCTDYIKIEVVTKPGNNAFYSVCNIYGQQILNDQPLNKNLTTINTCHLDPGLYIIAFYDQHSMKSQYFEKLKTM